MKFVKGDAIAGPIIVAVNLLGGIMIGTMQRGMTAGQAVKTYSVLDHRRRLDCPDPRAVHCYLCGHHRHACRLGMRAHPT